jgi:hypothetical protein
MLDAGAKRKAACGGLDTRPFSVAGRAVRRPADCEG